MAACGEGIGVRIGSLTYHIAPSQEVIRVEYWYSTHFPPCYLVQNVGWCCLHLRRDFTLQLTLLILV